MAEEKCKTDGHSMPFGKQGAKLGTLPKTVAQNIALRTPDLLGPLLVFGKFRDQLSDCGGIGDISCADGQHKGTSDRHEKRTTAHQPRNRACRNLWSVRKSRFLRNLPYHFRRAAGRSTARSTPACGEHPVRHI